MSCLSVCSCYCFCCCGRVQGAQETAKAAAGNHPPSRQHPTSGTKREQRPSLQLSPSSLPSHLTLPREELTLRRCGAGIDHLMGYGRRGDSCAQKKSSLCAARAACDPPSHCSPLLLGYPKAAAFTPPLPPPRYPFCCCKTEFACNESAS